MADVPLSLDKRAIRRRFCGRQLKINGCNPQTSWRESCPGVLKQSASEVGSKDSRIVTVQMNLGFGLRWRFRNSPGHIVLCLLTQSRLEDTGNLRPQFSVRSAASTPVSRLDPIARSSRQRRHQPRVFVRPPFRFRPTLSGLPNFRKKRTSGCQVFGVNLSILRRMNFGIREHRRLVALNATQVHPLFTGLELPG